MTRKALFNRRNRGQKKGQMLTTHFSKKGAIANAKTGKQHSQKKRWKVGRPL